MKTVAIYVRVSTQEQATEGYSIQEQQERLRMYCNAHGWKLVQTYIGRYAKQEGRKWKDKQPPLYYTCYSRSKKVPKMIKDPNCHNKNWKMEELDHIVFDEIQKLAFDSESITKLREEKSTKTDFENKITILRNEIHKLDEQISHFLDLYGIGKFTIEQVSNKIDPLNEQKQNLERKLDNITSETGMLSEEALALVHSFDEILKNGDFDEIRLVLETLISYIELDNEHLCIHWNFI